MPLCSEHKRFLHTDISQPINTFLVTVKQQNYQFRCMAFKLLVVCVLTNALQMFVIILERQLYRIESCVLSFLWINIILKLKKKIKIKCSFQLLGTGFFLFLFKLHTYLCLIFHISGCIYCPKTFWSNMDSEPLLMVCNENKFEQGCRYRIQQL